MQQRQLGERTVGAIGLGAMPLSVDGRPDDDGARAVLHAALDAGVTLVDTADAYALGADDVGHGERLLGRLLREAGRGDVLVATKGGHTRPPDGSWALDGSPAHLRAACEASLRALEVDVLGLYQLHRPDPQVPLEDSLGTLGELVDEGKVAAAGVSNLDEDQIRLAVRVLGPRLVSVQNEFSPVFRSSLGELRLCGELGLAFLPWSPLGGMSAAAGLGEQHKAFAEVAEERGATPQQVCLAWHLAQGEHVLPIPGSSRPETIRASAAAAELLLTPEELARL